MLLAAANVCPEERYSAVRSAKIISLDRHMPDTVLSKSSRKLIKICASAGIIGDGTVENRLKATVQLLIIEQSPSLVLIS